MDQPVPETIRNRPGHDRPDRRSDKRHSIVAMFSPPCLEGRGKPMLGRQVRQEERLLSRTRVCVDRVGAFDKLSEGVFCMLFPLARARPASHESLGYVGPAQPRHVDHSQRRILCVKAVL
jgi:hypothetical protein